MNLTMLASEHADHEAELRLPAFRTVRNKCLLFKAPSIWYSVIAECQTD